ncbi:23S rRNA (guanosine(2251)-2'-O)-methyltransferase RlmB, partial [Leptospira interrogans serovar Pomona]|nr:23S rRNA (guanosine(2251)-2'-O)-methyltransferase RlmB [Leptospira interrogans serovar Pomona]
FELFKENGYLVFSSSGRWTRNRSKLPRLNETVILKGNGRGGIKKNLMGKSEFVLRIPMHGNLSSFNFTFAPWDGFN